MTLDGIGALLLLVCTVLAWLALEVQRVHATVEPIANSSIVRGLTSV